jgi:chromosome segregation ATPase
MLTARVTQVQTKHNAKLVKQADIINRKQDSIEEQTSIHEKNICEMNDLMAEVNEERESAVSLFIKSEEKLLASKNAANALKMKLNRTETKLIEYQRLGANLQRRCEQLERSLVELDMEKSEYIAELEHDGAQAIQEFNVRLFYMARFNTHSILSNLCHYQFFNRN